jgi:hypothetical protein
MVMAAECIVHTGPTTLGGYRSLYKGLLPLGEVAPINQGLTTYTPPNNVDGGAPCMKVT